MGALKPFRNVNLLKYVNGCLTWMPFLPLMRLPPMFLQSPIDLLSTLISSHPSKVVEEY
jgi:hypothetical protein